MYLNAFDELQKAVRAGTCKTKTKKKSQGSPSGSADVVHSTP